MSITIKRNTGWMGMATNALVFINGEKVGKVAENTYLVVDIPSEKANLKIRHAGVKSDEIEVENGDIIEIKQRMWYRLVFPLYMLLLFLLIFISDLNIKLALIIGIGVLLIICMYIFNGYYLVITDKKEEDDILL